MGSEAARAPEPAPPPPLGAWSCGAEGPSAAPRRLPVAAGPRGARRELRSGRGRVAAGAGVLGTPRVARLAESPCRGPTAPCPPVLGEEQPAGARAHSAWPNRRRGPARGGGAGAAKKSAEAAANPISAAQPRRLGGGLLKRKASSDAPFPGPPHAPLRLSPPLPPSQGPLPTHPPKPSPKGVRWRRPGPASPPPSPPFPRPALHPGSARCGRCLLGRRRNT